MTTDFHILDLADLRVSVDPPSHVGWFLTSRQGILSTWSFQIIKCIIIKRNEKSPFLNVLRETSIGAEFGQFLSFRKFFEFLLVFTQQVFLYFVIILRKRVSNRKFCRNHHWFQILIRCGFLRTLWVSWRIHHTNPLPLRRQWAHWRK